MAKLTKTQKAARKAVATRKARDNFVKKYGTETMEVVSMILAGKSNWDIYDATWVPFPSIAAYRANVTRNTYDLSGMNL